MRISIDVNANWRQTGRFKMFGLAKYKVDFNHDAWPTARPDIAKISSIIKANKVND